MSHECHCHACCKGEHEHEEESELSVREIVIAAVLFALGLIVEHAHPFRAIDVSFGKFASADELVSIVLLLAA